MSEPIENPLWELVWEISLRLAGRLQDASGVQSYNRVRDVVYIPVFDRVYIHISNAVYILVFDRVDLRHRHHTTR